MSRHLRELWAGRVEASGDGFLLQPKHILYPCLFEGVEMRSHVRATLIATVEDALARQEIDRAMLRFWMIGSGISWNWDENGDADFQVWVHPDCPSSLADVRAAIEPLRGSTFASLGLATSDCPGGMQVQFYAKHGMGTEKDNLDQRPYALYDVDNDRWVIFPEPFTPEEYGARFLRADPFARGVAAEADEALAALERAESGSSYWSRLTGDHPQFATKAEQAAAELVAAESNVLDVYESVVVGRQHAYTPFGQGIDDWRDSVVKLLEVWGVFDRLKLKANDVKARRA